jgi:hypothetical protein
MRRNRGALLSFFVVMSIEYDKQLGWMVHCSIPFTIHSGF